jgi:hypothetical protein
MRCAMLMFSPSAGPSCPAVYHGGYSNKAPKPMQLIIAIIISAFFPKP